ncbi:HypC/HybG/HupF family hydrogenase formation chaperone [Ilumatobacter sp.]|uniref:HypC/HybG/HupF family hydrogenase formation chaperone n=1 Tax=Ilumatobacter sp. TaxID=1967498 RepID=UPI00345D6D64
MCLAVPGRIVDTREERGTTMGTIDFDGVRKDICLAYLPDIEVGEYAIVHAGFAISRVDEESALETLRMLEELNVLDDELGVTGGVVEP